MVLLSRSLIDLLFERFVRVGLFIEMFRNGFEYDIFMINNEYNFMLIGKFFIVLIFV